MQLYLVDTAVTVVCAVLEDTDRRLGRVTGRVEGDRAGVAVVVGDSTIEDDLGGRREVGCLLTVARTAGDFLQLAGDVSGIRRVRCESSEREEDDRVVRLSCVAVVVAQRLVEGFLVSVREALLEVVSEHRAGRGALGAGQ